MEKMVSNTLLQETYKGKRVFITGHTGFKGAWLSVWLHQLGAVVHGYSLPPLHVNSLFSIADSKAIFSTTLADIRNLVQLKNEILEFEPDFIFHLAAQPIVRLSYEIPSDTFDVNVTGTAKLLEAITHLKKPCNIIVITTDKVYENIEKDKLYNELDQLGGYDPYSASKACTELVVNSFRNSFFNPEKFSIHNKAISTVRAGNVIGGGDFTIDRIIPDIVRALQYKVTVGVRNPNSIRPWQHVLEPLSGYLLLGVLMKKAPLQFASSYNFGPLPADHLTVKEVVDIAINVWGSGNWEDLSSLDSVHEAKSLKLSIEKAINILGWKPKLDAVTAIEWTIDWYKQPIEKKWEMTNYQIKAYQSI